MFLQGYAPGCIAPDLVARVRARQVDQVVARLQSVFPEVTYVTTQERDLDRTQVAVLTAIADEQEADLLAALSSSPFLF
jgi:hypothetical protein